MNLSVDNFLLPNARKGRSVTEEKVVLKEGDFWMDLVGNGNNIIGKYKVSSSGIPAYYDDKQDCYFRINCSNSIKQSYLLRINGTSFDMRYVLMRSSAPDKYPYSNEHYRIEFKNSAIEYPCFVDNLIVHEGFSLNFEWFLNESVEWKWRSLKPEDKKNKKKIIKRKQTSTKQVKKTRKPTSRRSKQVKKQEPARKAMSSSSSFTAVPVTAVKKSARTKVAPVLVKKNIKMMSEKKFKALRFRMRLHIEISSKEREMYEEQKMLRRLKRFIG